MTAQAFAAVAFDETRRAVRSRLLIGSFVMCCVSSLLVVWLAHRDHEEQRRVYVEQLQAKLQLQLRFPTRVTGRTEEPGLRILRPPNPAAMLAQGETAQAPAAWEVGPAGTRALAPYSLSSTGGNGWDLETICRVFGGVLAVGLAVSSVVVDRNRGWLSVLSSSPPRPIELSIARLFGGLCTLLLLVGAWWAVMGLTLAAGWAGQALSIQRLFSLLPLAVLYVWIIHALSLAAVWGVRSNSRATPVAFTIWIWAAIVGPGSIDALGSLLEPLPTQRHFEALRQERYAEELSRVDQDIAQAAVARIRFGTVPEQDAQVEQQLRAMDAEWQQRLLGVRRLATELDDEWKTKIDRAQRLRAVLSWLAPGQLARVAMAEIATTGEAYLREWQRATHSYQQSLNRVLFDNRPIVTLTIPGLGVRFVHTQQRHEAPRFDELPDFEEPSSLATVRGAAGSILGLAAWLVASCIAATMLGARAIARPFK